MRILGSLMRTVTAPARSPVLMDPSSAGGGIFTQLVNPMTGRSEWQMQPPDYDYQQEVARAAFADMLHDSERNRLYYEGLKVAIGLQRQRGQPVHVLDIGTGTGLLSMMAAQIGADSITAIEEFRPMANCAERVIRDNGWADAIKLVRKRSTNVTVGPGLDMERRANILVTEVFDTELIGEGAIGTYNHAHRELLTTDCLVVPAHATMFAQVVSSDLCSRWNTVQPIRLGSEGVLDPPDREVDGISFALHDVQLSQMKESWFQPLTEPVPVFEFDFTGRSGPIPLDEQTSEARIAQQAGACDAIFIWWDLKMDPNEAITLSCAPHWAHPNGPNLPWRDHWMQAIYYPASSLSLDVGESFQIVSRHDEYSLTFDVAKSRQTQLLEVPPSRRGIQWAVSRTRLGQMNDSKRNEKLVRCIQRCLKDLGPQPSVWLFLSELSLAPLMAAKLGASQVIVAEGNHQMQKVLEEYIAKHNLHTQVTLLPKSVVDLSKDDLPEKVDVVFAEPYFSASLLPWHNLLYWFSINKLCDATSQIRHLPFKASIWCIPVEYSDLWKIRSPLLHVEGFQMRHFDDIILSACDVSDANVEPHPLWEYPCRARGPATRLMEIDLEQKLPPSKILANEAITLWDPEAACNGMAVWMEWSMDDETTLSTGPTSLPTHGEPIEWDVHCHQGVFFFPEDRRKPLATEVACSATFEPKQGDIKFQFNQCQ